MGMDVSFSRKDAINSGLKLVRATNGSPESIKEAELEAKENPSERGMGYLKWLQREEELVKVPFTDLLVCNDSSDDETIVVRANRWGQVYRPLTTWLRNNRIIWDEWA